MTEAVELDASAKKADKEERDKRFELIDRLDTIVNELHRIVGGCRNARTGFPFAKLGEGVVALEELVDSVKDLAGPKE